MNKLHLGLRALVLATAILTAGPVTLAPQAHATPQARRVANPTLDFTLVNDTGYDIGEIYIGASKDEEWSDNLIKETFEDGDSIPWSFHPDTEETHWDMSIRWAEPYEDEEPVIWYNLDLSQISVLTLHYDEKTDKTWATAE